MWLLPNGTHFEPQRASVRASRLEIACESGPHAGALRLRNYKYHRLDLWIVLLCGYWYIGSQIR